MWITVLLYGYCLPLTISIISAGWFQWFSRDEKATLGSVLLLIIGVVPILNIWFALMSIWFTPYELKKYFKYKNRRRKYQ